MTPRRPGRRSAVAGFTLIEILVVMTLLSTVMLALGASMRTIAQTEARVDQKLQQADELRVAANFLSGALQRISPLKADTPVPSGASVFLFASAPDSVEWLGVMPARFGAGGRTFFRLAVEPHAQGRALVIRFIPWTGIARLPDWSTAQFRVLAPEVTRLLLEYGNDANAQAAWLPQWPFADRLPRRVRLSVSTPSGDWPYLTVPLRQLPAADSGRGGFSLGPE